MPWRKTTFSGSFLFIIFEIIFDLYRLSHYTIQAFEAVNFRIYEIMTSKFSIVDDHIFTERVRRYVVSNKGKICQSLDIKQLFFTRQPLLNGIRFFLRQFYKCITVNVKEFSRVYKFFHDVGYIVAVVC